MPSAVSAPLVQALPAEGALVPASLLGQEALARLLRALADPIRLRLVEYLVSGPHTGTECVDHVGLSQGRVSTHLRCLVSCGLVKVRREGRFAYYRVDDPRVAELVTLARGLVADHFSGIAVCTQVG